MGYIFVKFRNRCGFFKSVMDVMVRLCSVENVEFKDLVDVVGFRVSYLLFFDSYIIFSILSF